MLAFINACLDGLGGLGSVNGKPYVPTSVSISVR